MQVASRPATACESQPWLDPRQLTHGRNPDMASARGVSSPVLVVRLVRIPESALDEFVREGTVDPLAVCWRNGHVVA